jgi:hypothetical protein
MRSRPLLPTPPSPLLLPVIPALLLARLAVHLLLVLALMPWKWIRSQAGSSIRWPSRCTCWQQWTAKQQHPPLCLCPPLHHTLALAAQSSTSSLAAKGLTQAMLLTCPPAHCLLLLLPHYQ